MSESKSASVVFTNSSLLAKNAQVTADSAKTAAEVAQNQAITAQKTADGKNSVYRGSDPSTVPTAGLKEGDLYFADNAVYTWTGTAWEKTVSDTTGTEINAKVEAAMQESQKSVADLKADVESKVSEIDSNLSATTTDLTNVKTDLDDTKNNLTTTTNDIKANLSAVSSDLSATKTSLADTRDSLATTTNDLSSVKADLADTKNNLTTTTNDIKNSLSAVSSDLSATKTNLEDTKTSLSTTVADLQKQTGQLSGSLSTANSKIEYNSQAIAEVKHTAEEISTTVSNIRVGGRNLLTNSKGPFKPNRTSYQGGYDNYNEYPNSTIAMVQGQKYTISAVAADGYVFTSTHTPTVASKNIALWIVNGNDVNQVVSSATTAFSDGGTTFTWNHASGTYRLRVNTYESTPAGYVTNVKVEVGTMATDWTPAPEDTDQAISKVSQTADAIRADLTNAKGDIASVKATANSLQSQITDNKNNISSVKQTADSLTTRMANAEGNVSSLQQTAQGLTTRVTNTEGNVSSLQQTASGLQSDLTNAKGDISNLQQTANGLTSRVGSAEKNISQLQQTADSLTSTVGKMPEQWQQAINDKVSAQVLDSNVDMNNLTTAGTYLIKDSSVKNSPIGAWFMATVEATADHLRVVQRVKKDDANVAYERSSREGGWTDWERIATGTDVSSIKQTMDSITTRVTNTEGDVSTLQETANSLNAYVRGSKGSKTLESILSMDPNNSTIAQVVNGNVVAAINTSSDGSVKIDGKNLYISASTKIDDAVIKSAMIDSIDASKITTGELDAEKVTIKNLTADKIASGTLNGMTITGSTFVATGSNVSVENNDFVTCGTKVNESGFNVYANNQFDSRFYASGLKLYAGASSLGERTIEASVYDGNPYLKVTKPGSFSWVGADNIWSELVKGNEGQFANWKFSGSKVLAQSGSLYVTNPSGGNFDDNGSVGFQVWSGIGLGKNTIYTPDTDIYIQQGNVGPALGQSYSSANKTTIHAQKLISQVANTVASRLSIKTDITPVSYDRALAAIEGTEMYDYRYVSDDSGQHYVSGIIDDINPDPQYHMDEMLINKERTARIDSNLVGYHHVIIQKLLERVAALEEKVK